MDIAKFYLIANWYWESFPTNKMSQCFQKKTA